MSRNRASGWSWLAAIALVLPALGGPATSAGTAAIQLDVTASGNPEAIADLAASDIRLRVDGRSVDGATLDLVCRTDADAAPASVVLYVDVTHLTIEGYHNAYAAAQALVDRVVDPRVEAMIVVSGQSLKLLTDFTTDRAALRDGLARAQRDPELYDAFAATEGQRTDQDAATAIRALEARQHQDEERFYAERSLGRLQYVLTLLADRPQPKSVVVFADTLRGNPGEHHAARVPATDPVLHTRDITDVANHRANRFRFETGADLSRPTVASLLDTAAALGVRLYGVEGRGIGGGNTLRRRHAQDFLVSLSRETGGLALLRGTSPKRLVRAIGGDLNCTHVVRFAATGFDEERPLAVWLDAPDAGIKLRTRASVVLPGEARLLATQRIARYLRSEALQVLPAANQR